MANYTAKISDQRLSKGNSGDPLLTLTVELTGVMRDRFDPSFGTDPLPGGSRKERIFLDFGTQKLSKTLEYLEAMGVKGATAASFHPANKARVSLVGKEVIVWDSKNEVTGKVYYRISKPFKKKEQEEVSLDDIRAWDQENKDAYESANEPAPY